jgi:hypothetical protein
MMIIIENMGNSTTFPVFCDRISSNGFNDTYTAWQSKNESRLLNDTCPECGIKAEGSFRNGKKQIKSENQEYHDPLVPIGYAGFNLWNRTHGFFKLVCRCREYNRKNSCYVE